MHALTLANDLLHCALAAPGVEATRAAVQLALLTDRIYGALWRYL